VELINVHAPTEDKGDTKKKEFSATLEDVHASLPENIK